MMDTNPTLQTVIADRLASYPLLMDPEPAGHGFSGVWKKWLLEEGDGAEPEQFTTGGRIKPNIVVLNADRNPHPSRPVPGWAKWDEIPTIHLFHYPSDHGKAVLQSAIIAIENRLTDPTWVPVITGGQLPMIHANPGVTPIDNREAFPGNYVIMLRFRVTGLRAVAVS